MAKKTYKGSCHCGRITFEADLDLAAGTSKCNCSFCTKTRNWGIHVKPESFRLLTGEDDLKRYPLAPKGPMHHPFCGHCGVRVFSRGNIPELGGELVGVRITALDDATPEELVAAPVRYTDGRNDAWWNPPAETRHL